MVTSIVLVVVFFRPFDEKRPILMLYRVAWKIPKAELMSRISSTNSEADSMLSAVSTHCDSEEGSFIKSYYLWWSEEETLAILQARIWSSRTFDAVILQTMRRPLQ